MEEDGWEVVKCYLSDHLASDSQDEKQLNKARREAASNKKKREANKLKDRKKQFWKCPPPPPPLPLSLFRRNIETFGYSDEGQGVPTKINSKHQKSVIPAEKKDISSITIPLEERDDFDFMFKRDWEITEKNSRHFSTGKIKTKH